MAKRNGLKIKRMTPEKVAEKRAAARLKVVNEIGAAIGIPEMQRRSDQVEIRDVEQLDGAAVAIKQTLRKLTRVEKLRRSGVLEAHEADACEWYADRAALAWDTVGCTANYDGVGSANYVGAADRAHMVSSRIAEARADYGYASKAVPIQYLGIFEAVICENSAIAAVAAETFSALGRSQREHKTRAIVKLCANLVHGVIAHRLPIEAALTAKSQPVAEPTTEDLRPRLSDEIGTEIGRKSGATQILMSADVLAALMREEGLDDRPESWSGLEIIVSPHWSWAWIVQ